MPRCFLLEPTRAEFNLESVKNYGEIKLLFPAGFPISLGQPDIFESAIIDRLQQVDYDCCSDYIIVSGKLSRIACTMAIIGTKFEEIKLLVYNDRTGEYTPASFRVPDYNENKKG